MALRPSKLSEFLENTNAIDVVTKAILEDSPDDILLYGESSSGKTCFLELLKRAYADKVYFVSRDVCADKLENIRRGEESPYSVHDFFTSTIDPTKKIVLLCDDIETLGLSKQFFKKPRAVLLIATANLQSYRSWKTNFRTCVQLVRPTQEVLLPLVACEKACTEATARKLIEENRCDIRGILKSLHISSKEYVLTRDPTEDIVTRLMRAQSDYHRGANVQDICHHLEPDRFNLKFYLFENYPSLVTDMDRTAETFSAADTEASEHTTSGLFTCMGVLTPIVQLKRKINNRGRVSKLVSRKNQAVINHNRIHKTRTRYSPYGSFDLVDTYLVSSIYRSSKDKNIIWMNKQFK